MASVNSQNDLKGDIQISNRSRRFNSCKIAQASNTNRNMLDFEEECEFSDNSYDEADLFEHP